MNYDNGRIEAALKALMECSEAEALAAFFAYQRDMKTRGPGRPRGKAKPKDAAPDRTPGTASLLGEPA